MDNAQGHPERAETRRLGFMITIKIVAKTALPESRPGSSHQGAGLPSLRGNFRVGGTAPLLIDQGSTTQ